MSNNLIKSMKESIAAAGASKRDIIYFKSDDAIRVRFLTELDAGVTVTMHNQFHRMVTAFLLFVRTPRSTKPVSIARTKFPCKNGMRGLCGTMMLLLFV